MSLNWQAPLMCNDGVKATLFASLSSSGKITYADGSPSGHAEQWAELHEMGVRHLVIREGEEEYRAFRDQGTPIDIHLDELFGHKPARAMFYLENAPAVLPADVEALESSGMWGMF